MSQTAGIVAVIFDMDGVLTDSEPLINAAAIAMFKERGLEVHPDDFLPFVGAGEDRYIGGVAEKYAFPLDLAAAKRRTYELYLELVPARLAAFPGARDLVAACRQAGLRVAVASSADRIKIAANLRQLGLPLETWDAAVVGEEVTIKKPAPDIFLAAAARLGLAPEQCVVVEDAVNGVQAAKAAGMRCVAVAQTFSPDHLRDADLVRPTIGAVSVANLIGSAIVAPLLAPPAWPPLPAPSRPAADRVRPWGFWASLGLGLAVGAVWVAAQLVVGILWVIGSDVLRLGSSSRDLDTNGLFLSLATCASAPAAFALTWLFARLRSPAPLTGYLAFRPVAPKALGRWCLVLVLLAMLSDGLTYALGRPIVPDFMVRVYATARFVPLLWLAIIIVAPVAEESLYRGFLFEGFRHSAVGPAGAIVLTSLLWALTHLQYDAYGMTTIFVSGLLLGYVRLRTQSVYAAICLHSLMNLLATLEAACLPASLMHR